MISTLFILLLILGGMRLILIAVTVGIYDAKRIGSEKKLKAHPYKALNRKRPLVTIVINTHNHEDDLDLSLKYLLSNRYKKIEIIVIDQSSTDKTRKIAKQFIGDHPKHKIKLIIRKSKSANSYNKLMKNHLNGELVLLISPGGMIHKRALINGVQFFNNQQNLNVIKLRKNNDINYNLVGLLQKYENFFQVEKYKKNAVLQSKTNINATNLIYRRAFFLETLRFVNVEDQDSILSLQYNFANNSIITYKSTDTLFSLFKYHLLKGINVSIQTKFRLIHSLMNNREVKVTEIFVIINSLITIIVTLLLPAFLIYFISISLEYHQSSFLLLSIVTYSLIGTYLILGNSTDKFIHKLLLILGLPITYFVFLFYSIELVFASVLGLVLPKRNHNSNW